MFFDLKIGEFPVLTLAPSELADIGKIGCAEQVVSSDPFDFEVRWFFRKV